MRLSEVRRFALALPGVTEEPHFHYLSFRVNGKIFATVSPKAEHLHIFVGEEQREAALAMHSAYLEKLFWGKRISGLRAVLSKANPRVVKSLLSQAWLSKAPKRRVLTTKPSL